MKKKIILFLIGVLIILMVIKFAGFGNIYHQLKDLDQRLFVLALGLHFFIIGVRTFRWKLILSELGDDAPFHTIYKVVVTGIFINNMTPGRIAGDPMRAIMLRSSMEKEKKFSTIIVEKMIDLLVLASITTVCAAFLFRNLPVKIGILGIAASAFILCIIIFFYYSVLRGELASIVNVIMKPLPLKSKKKEVLQFVRKAQEGVRDIKNPKIIGMTAILSLVCWFLEPLRFFIIFKSLGCEIPFVTVVAVYLFSLTLGMVPITPGGIGTMESFIILFLQAFNIGFVTATTATLLDRFISFWIITIIGVFTGISIGISETT
ncbi:MAG: lysylphosphatidylglycerol synthase transmembrane domain-containing protein [Euryarchaeota archaeon]|nr:lysylphosphatidylglycerol synthase transmembrane domain-containing protein [Euryarchaeota archaeon]